MPRQSKKKRTDTVNNEGIINVLNSDKNKRKTMTKRNKSYNIKYILSLVVIVI